MCSFSRCVRNAEIEFPVVRTDSVIASVDQSKRTILLVSKHYFGSIWTEYEFQVAHLQVHELFL